MIKLFFKTTDDFLYNVVQKTFEKIENGYKHRDIDINLETELKNFEFDPIIVTSGSNSNFEKDLKFKLKMILGVFFVITPFVGSAFISNIFDLGCSYAAVFTFIVAMLAASRMDEIVRQYVEKRMDRLS